MRDIEVEVSYWVDEEFWKSFFERCRKEGKFIRHEKQHDEYYRPSHKDWASGDFTPEWLSIRERGNGVMINYKNWKSDGVRCDEYETSVGDAEPMRKIFAAIDMQKLITVHKERDVFMLGEFEVAMDVCEGLGCFIEVEVKGDYASSDVAVIALRKFAAEIGLDKFEEDHKGYSRLLMERRGKKSL